MKFDFCIGNPPYQEENENNNRQAPIYNLFMDDAFNIADTVEMIHPARFLFNAGQTPKAWNEKMLNDEHFKVLTYEPDASKVFSNTDIKGGIAITIRDSQKKYGAIEIFTSFDELNSILHKVYKKNTHVLSEKAYSKSYYGFTNNLYHDFPNLKDKMTKGNEFIIDADIFRKMPDIFKYNGNDAITVVGRENGTRVKKKLNRKYIKNVTGIDEYKLFSPGANGSGHFGEALTAPEIGRPGEIATQTFMTFGFFNTEKEAENFAKYLKTKFSRCMLGILKVTQNAPRDVWKYVPLQDFTQPSDIDWNTSIRNIDKQLYKKYDLSEKEIKFIESNVKEMV